MSHHIRVPIALMLSLACAAGVFSFAASCPETVTAIETAHRRSALGASESLIVTGRPLDGSERSSSLIEIFDWSLRRLGSIELPDTVLAIEVDNSSAAVVVGSFGGPLVGYWATDLFVLDLTDPASPEIATSQAVSTRDIERSGNLVWIVEDERLLAHDLSTWEVVTDVDLTFDAAVGDLDTATGLLWLKAGDRACAVDIGDPGQLGDAVCGALEIRELLSVENGVALSSWTYGPSTLQPTLVADVSEPDAALLLAEIPQPEIQFDGRWALAPTQVWDLDEPAAPVLVGRGQSALWQPLGDGTALRSTAEQLAIVDLNACDAAPPVADFSWTPEAPITGEPVRFEGAGSPGDDLWLWAIDGAISLSGHSVEHRFEVGGDHIVQLVRRNETGEDTVTRDVVVRGISDAASWTIPAVAHLDGFGDVRWRTELTMTISGGADALAFFVPRGGIGEGALGQRVPWPGSEVPMAFPSALHTLFGVEHGAGALMIAGANARATLVATSPAGEYRQSVPLLKATPGERYLVGLREDNGFRTNLGLVSLHTAVIELDVDFFSTDGAFLTTRSVELRPYEPLQINRPLVEVAAAASARVTPRPAVAGARFVAYSSVIDGGTGDAAFAPAVLPSGEALWVPAAAHADGFSGTRWRSEVSLCATGPHDARFQPFFAPRGSSELVAGPLLRLISGVCARYPDAVRDLFGIDGVGAIRIDIEAGELVGSSRTFTPTETGTYGQAVPVLSAAAVDAACSSGVLLGLEENTTARTNVGVVNTGSSPAGISLHMYDQNGASVGSTRVELTPRQHRQLDRVFRDHTEAAIDGGSIFFFAEPGAPILVYGSVVREDTGDPIYIAPACSD